MIHDAAVCVDVVLEKTPVPAVAEVLADDALDMIEKVDPLPKTAATNPRVAEIKTFKSHNILSLKTHQLSLLQTHFPLGYVSKHAESDYSVN